LFSYIDNLLGESAHLPEALGLQEQIYRLVALAIMQSTGSMELHLRRSASTIGPWNAKLDELVDYIRANIHLNLTLTDLEEHSHYSARHLQNLFREKFECTPMQFVKKHRLTKAMEALQTADEDDTVISISRTYGYRSSSSFTTEFRREFGINPSRVLRASRGGGAGKGKSQEFQKTINQNGSLSNLKW
jgi:AraC-like DNA-binding protein